ncbi:MAG: PqiC family protein [Deltaproteobacteria bacterium]|jgi:ABC-type uncharacterized transport system auxiliary subunit|nr:PqiC family protein [Deltaproteobacteria bacterium]
MIPRRVTASPGTFPTRAATLAIVSFFLAGLLVGLLPGCGFSRPYPTIRTFDLEGPTPGKLPAKVRRPLLIQVTTSGAAPQYETRKLVYKIGRNEFREDFYSELVGMPVRLVAAQLAGYLDANTDRFRATQGVTAQSPDLTIDVYLLAFHGDFSLKPPLATVEVKATLTDQRGGRPRTLLSNNYLGTEELPAEPDDRPKALAIGLAQALNPILADIAADLGPALSGRR